MRASYRYVSGLVTVGDGVGSDSNSRIDGQVRAFAATNTVRRSVILGGIVTDDGYQALDLTITDNLIANSPGAGIHLGGSFSRPDVAGSISGNIIYRSGGAGITTDGTDLDHLLIAHNWLVDNGGDGVTIAEDPYSPFGGGSTTITGNVAVFQRRARPKHHCPRDVHRWRTQRSPAQPPQPPMRRSRVSILTAPDGRYLGRFETPAMPDCPHGGERR